ncbi:hypothetical protein ACQKFL_14180 [Vreelandella titanicae]|uniref:hypothetical protein n=1 Tax=Vreelandella titanicae TaxID=664683 RepID=UPI00137639AB|nr:hypothetical protein [Halomonas titanicae]
MIGERQTTDPLLCGGEQRVGQLRRERGNARFANAAYRERDGDVVERDDGGLARAVSLDYADEHGRCVISVGWQRPPGSPIDDRGIWIGGT